MNQIKTTRDNIQSLPPKKTKKKKRIVKRGWQKSISLSNEQKQRLICIEILTLRQSSTIELLLEYRSNIIFISFHVSLRIIPVSIVLKVRVVKVGSTRRKRRRRRRAIKQRGKRMEWRFVSLVCARIQRNGSYKIMRRRGKSLTRRDHNALFYIGTALNNLYNSWRERNQLIILSPPSSHSIRDLL